MKTKTFLGALAVILAVALPICLFFGVTMYKGVKGLVEDYKATNASLRETIDTQKDLLRNGFPACAYLMRDDDGFICDQSLMLANTYTGDSDLIDCAEFIFDFDLSEHCTGIRIDLVNNQNVKQFTVNELGQVYIPN